MRRKFFIFGAIAILALGLGLWALPSRLNGTDKQKSAEPTATATRETVETKLLLSGEVTPAFQVEVKGEVGGKVKTIHVNAGDRVKKGDLLVTIDDTDLLNELASAETEIDGARLSVDKNRGNYERARALFEQKLISKEVFANLEADFKISENTLEKSERRLQTVKDRLSKTRILSPGDGTILDIMVNEGQVVVAAASVNSGTTLMLFADVSRLLINTHVNQMDVARLKPGAAMTINMIENSGDPLAARIEFIAPIATVKNNIKGFEVQATIDDNDGRLKPGMSVSMDVPIERVDSAITVPVAAVFREKGDKVVYVRKAGSIERRKVAVGLTDLSRAEIKSGIDEGDEILLIEPPALHEKS